MEFREGMLGVVIVGLAIVGALGVSYFAGIEPTDVEVTKYEYLADVSGLFDYDQSPQYIEFDPSTNYVGYYSTDTGEYWPVDSVGYERNQNVNNYRVKLEPNTLSASTVSLGTYTEGVVDPFDGKNVRITFNNRDTAYYSNQQLQEYPTTVTLKSYIAAMELGQDVTDIEFRSTGTYTEGNVGQTYNANWVVFTADSMWVKGQAALSENVHLDLATEGWFNKNGVTPPYSWSTAGGTITYVNYLPCLSCSVDLTTGIATLYYDNDCKNAFVTQSIDNIYMTYGGTSNTFMNTIVFDSSAQITVLHTDKEYLNPNYGVTMKG